MINSFGQYFQRRGGLTVVSGSHYLPFNATSTDRSCLNVSGVRKKAQLIAQHIRDGWDTNLKQLRVPAFAEMTKVGSTYKGEECNLLRTK